MLDKASIVREAQKHLAKGAVDKAIAELDRLVKENPDGNTLNMIGDLYLKKGSQKNATDYYRKAANFFWHEGFSQKAQALYKKVLNINPADTDALYAFGGLSEEKGLVTDAIKYYLAAADILAKEGRKEKILDIYQKILSLSPANIPLRVKVAEIFIKEGLISDAAREYLHIARFHDETGDVQKAKEYFRKAIDIQPLYKEAAMGISLLYEKVGEVPQAMEHMKDAVVLFPEDLDILFRCAELSLRSDNTGRAKECLIKIIAKEPGNIRARRMLGELYLAAGSKEKAWEQYLPALEDILADLQYEDAVSLLETFRPLDPVETGRRLASLFRQFGDPARACDELISLGDLYAAQGKEEDARACYSETLQIDPEHATAALRLAPPEPFHEPEPEIIPAAETGPDEPSVLVAPGHAEPSVREFPEAAKKADSGHISLKGDKSFDEVITEADIFSRYGLLQDAQKLLENLRQRYPDNIDLHLRLKNLYRDMHDKASAVTECLVLSELYRRREDIANAEQSLKDAFEISPEDPRIAEHGFERPGEPASLSGAGGFGEALSQKEPDIEDYEEEIAEADFYARQGLTTEAVKILEKLHALFPENRNVRDRLQALDQTVSLPEHEELEGSLDMSGAFELPESAGPPGEIETPGTAGDVFMPEEELNDDRIELPEEQDAFDAIEQIKETAEQVQPAAPDAVISEAAEGPKPPAEEKYEDFSFSDSDLVEVQEMPEPTLDNDVLEIFQEFKKGLEKELGDEDSETHYNLGIAYKEMGLVDDAIKEFQTSRNDPMRFIQSSTMLGVCYMEKGLYSLAVDVLVKALREVKEQDETYWAITYELAEAQEKCNNLNEALDLYTAVYGWNAKFRNVSDKMSQLRGKVPKPAENAKDQGKEPSRERKNRVSYL